MTIYEVADKLGASVAVVKLTSNGVVKYRAAFEPCHDVQLEHGLAGSCGFGVTEEQALTDLIGDIAGQIITCDGFKARQHRRTVNVPADLEIGEPNAKK